MACHLSIYDPGAKTQKPYVCDEDNTARVMQDDHAAGATGEYTDVDGNAFSIDWTKQRLVGFRRDG